MSVIIYLLIGILNVASQFIEGATLSLIYPVLTVIVNVSILVFMVNSSIGAIKRSDKITLAFVLLILPIWFFTNNAALAIVLLTLINVISKVLVMQKVYAHPNSEPIKIYMFWIMGSIFTLLTFDSVDVVLMLPAINNIVTQMMIVGIMLIGRRAQNNISTLG